MLLPEVWELFEHWASEPPTNISIAAFVGWKAPLREGDAGKLPDVFDFSHPEVFDALTAGKGPKTMSVMPDFLKRDIAVLQERGQQKCLPKTV